MMNRLWQGRTPKQDDDDEHGDVIMSDQYVFVDVEDEEEEVEEEEEDDELVVIPTADVVGHPADSSVKRESTAMMDVVPTVSTTADVVVQTNDRKLVDEEEEYEDGWDDNVEDVFGDFSRSIWKTYGAVVLFFVMILLLDAGWWSMYFLDQSAKGTIRVEQQRRVKYVPVAAPTERTTDELYSEFHWIDPTVVNQQEQPPTHRFPGNGPHGNDDKFTSGIHISNFLNEAKNCSDFCGDFIVTTSRAPMIPTIRRSTSMSIQAHPVSTETPRVSIYGPAIRPSSSCTPMRPLIPYSTPRRVEKLNQIPSVREVDDWIPTNNWTMSSSSSSETDVIEIEIDPTPDVSTIYPPDHRSWSIGVDVDPTAPSPSRSVDLTEYTFRDFIRQHEHVLVTFYLPCQRFTTKFVPLWTKLTNSIQVEHLPVVTATVDCDSHPNICREQGCYRFPTIRWFYKGNVHVEDYSRGRNAHKLLIFVKNTLEQINERIDYHFDNRVQAHRTIVEPVKAPRVFDQLFANERKDMNHDSDRMNGHRRLEEAVALYMATHKTAVDSSSWIVDAQPDFHARTTFEQMSI